MFSTMTNEHKDFSPTLHDGINDIHTLMNTHIGVMLLYQVAAEWRVVKSGLNRWRHCMHHDTQWHSARHYYQRSSCHEHIERSDNVQWFTAVNREKLSSPRPRSNTNHRQRSQRHSCFPDTYVNKKAGLSFCLKFAIDIPWIWLVLKNYFVRTEYFRQCPCTGGPFIQISISFMWNHIYLHPSSVVIRNWSTSVLMSLQWRTWRNYWHDCNRPVNKGQGHSIWYRSTSYRLSIITFPLGRTVTPQCIFTPSLFRPKLRVFPLSRSMLL